MSATLLTRARDHRRAPVEDVTVILLTHPGGPVVDQALETLAQQTHPPHRVVVAGVPVDDEEVAQARAHPVVTGGTVQLLVREPSPIGGEPPLWRAVEDARGVVPADDGHWLWLLHDDSVPEPAALQAMIEATRRSSGVAIVGPKLVSLDDPRRLVAVGQGSTRGGRPAEPGMPGQIDQGQYDQRNDVLAVPLTGMLVRADVLDALGGIEQAFDHGTEGLDLSWRCHLAGHRVVLAPAAVVRVGPAGMPEAGLAARRRACQVALARASAWAWPWRSLAVLVASLLAGLTLLLLKRPRAAAAELAAAAAALSPWRGLGARWRFRGRRVVRGADLRGLFAPPLEAWRGAGDAAHEPATSPVAAPSLRAGRSWPLMVALLLAAAATVARWRDLWDGLGAGGHGVRGGELWPVQATSADLWHAWRDGWAGAGLGDQSGEGPWLVPMAALTWVLEQLPRVGATGSPAAASATWLLVAAIPASALTAYLASGTGVRSRWVQAAAGVTWAGLAPLSAAVDGGRLGPVVAHVLLPLVVAGIAVAAERGPGSRGTSAAFGAVLAATVVAAFVPPLLVLTTGCGLLLLVLGPGWGGRARGLVVAVLPWALLGPWVGRVWDNPLLLLGGPGVSTTDAAPPPWQLLLLHPGGSLSPTLWWTVPLLVLATGSALVPGRPGRRAGLLLLGALLSLAAALTAPWLHLGRVPVGYSDGGVAVTVWPGLLLSAAGACLVLAATHAGEAAVVAGRARLPARRAPRSTAATAGTVVALTVTAVTAVAGLAMLASTAWSGAASTMVLAAAPAPPVVTEQARGPEAVRMLELTPHEQRVQYRLHGAEPGLWVRDRVSEMVATDHLSDADPAASALDTAVTDLVGPAGAPPDGVGHHAALHDLAVGYVSLRADEAHPLAARFDATAGLTRLHTTPGTVLWRVGPAGVDDNLVAVSRVRLTAGDGTPLATVPATGAHAAIEGVIGPVRGAELLVVAEAAGWSQVATVSIDGQVVLPQPGRWPPTYSLFPASPVDPGGSPVEVRIDVPPQASAWHLATALMVVVTIFLALPLGSRRRRRAG